MNAKHDTFFKKSLSYKQVSVPLLKKELPAHISRHMDFSQVETVSSNFITERLGQKHSDVILKVSYKGEGAYVFILIEHQSSPDPLMTVRIFLYILLLVQEIHKQNVAERRARAKEGIKIPPRKLPIVFPMVFYNGTLKFHNLKLADCFEDPELFSEILNNAPLLVNAADDEASEHDTPRYLLFRRLMGFINNEELSRILLDLEPEMLHIDKEGRDGTNFLVLCFKYLLESARHFEEQDIQEFVTKLEQSRGDFMTVMEQIEHRVSKSYEEKIAQALRKQQEEMARLKEEELRKQREEINRDHVLSLLQRGFDPKNVAEILQVDLAYVQSLTISNK